MSNKIQINNTANLDEVSTLKMNAKGPFYVRKDDTYVAYPEAQIEPGEAVVKYVRARGNERPSKYIAVDTFFGGVWPLSKAKRTLLPFGGEYGRAHAVVPVRRAKIQPKTART